MEKGSKTEIALLKFLKLMGHSDYDNVRKSIDARDHRRFNFSSTRKRSSFVLTVDESNHKRVHVKGAAEVVCERSNRYISTSGKDPQPITEDVRTELVEVVEQFNT
jgi:Ca2+ transporting ATPase